MKYYGKSRAIALLLFLFFLGGCSSAADASVMLGNYKGVTYQVRDTSVTEQQLQAAVYKDMKTHGYAKETVLTEGTVGYGDTVTVDYAFQGEEKNEQKNAVITVGDNEFLEDFENGLIGLKIGQTAELQISFPVDYLKTVYAGKTVPCQVTVRSIRRFEYPALSDRIVQTISDYSDVATYRSKKRETLQQEALKAEDERIENELWQKVADASSVSEYPQKELKRQGKHCRMDFEQAAQKENMSLSDYLTQNNLTEQEYESYVQAYAERTCKQVLLDNAIAKAEGIEVSKSEIDALAEKYADSYGYESVSDFYKANDKTFLEHSLLHQKVLDIIVESATAEK